MSERAPEQFENYASDETQREPGSVMQKRHIMTLKQSDVSHEDGQCQYKLDPQDRLRFWSRYLLVCLLVGHLSFAQVINVAFDRTSL